jgi:hypothetical protein
VRDLPLYETAVPVDPDELERAVDDADGIRLTTPSRLLCCDDWHRVLEQNREMQEQIHVFEASVTVSSASREAHAAVSHVRIRVVLASFLAFWRASCAACMPGSSVSLVRGGPAVSVILCMPVYT